MSESLVRVDKVSKSYTRGKEKIEVLRELSMEVPQGDFLALMGPSGSGKTTLLNLLGGLDHPTTGSITIGGERIDISQDDDVALHALELEDGRGPDRALFVRHVGIIRDQTEASRLSLAGKRLPPCPAHAQHDDVLGSILTEVLVTEHGHQQVEVTART